MKQVGSLLNKMSERQDDQGYRLAKNEDQLKKLEGVTIKIISHIGDIGHSYQASARTAAWGTVGIVASLAAGLLTYRLSTDCWKSSGFWNHLGCWGNYVLNPPSEASFLNRTINTLPWLTAAVSIFPLALGVFNCLADNKALAVANQKFASLTGLAKRLDIQVKELRAAEAAQRVRDQAFSDQIVQLKAQQIQVGDVILGASTLGAVTGVGFCVAGPLGSMIGVATISLGVLIGSYFHRR